MVCEMIVFCTPGCVARLGKCLGQVCWRSLLVLVAEKLFVGWECYQLPSSKNDVGLRCPLLTAGTGIGKTSEQSTKCVVPCLMPTSLAITALKPLAIFVCGLTKLCQGKRTEICAADCIKKQSEKEWKLRYGDPVPKQSRIGDVSR